MLLSLILTLYWNNRFWHKLLDMRVRLMLQSLFVCRWLLTGGTVIPVSLIAVVSPILEKSVFYGYLAVA